MGNNKGYTIIESIVAIAIIGIGIGGFITFSVMILKNQRNLASETVIENKKNEIIQNLNSRVSWLKTINFNNIACLKRDGGNCSAVGGPFPIAVINGNDVQLTDLAVGNRGFDKHSDFCVYGNANCPFRFLVSWSPICESAVSCKEPIVQISATLERTAEAEDQVPIAAAHNFNYIRGSFTIGSKDNCQSVGGTFDDATWKCLLPNNNQRCPDGRIVKGMNADGTIDCQPLVNSACAAGEYAKGVNPDGTLLCYPLAGACTGNPPNGYNPDPNSGFSSGGGDGGGDCGDGGGDCG